MPTDIAYLRELAEIASLPTLMRDTLRDAAVEIERLREVYPASLAALRELYAVAPSTPPAAGLIVGIEDRHRAAIAAARAVLRKAE